MKCGQYAQRQISYANSSVSNLFCIFFFNRVTVCLRPAVNRQTSSRRKKCKILSNLFSADALPTTVGKIHRILCSLLRVPKSSLAVLLELVLLKNISTNHFCYKLLLSVCFCIFIFSSNIVKQGCMK